MAASRLTPGADIPGYGSAPALPANTKTAGAAGGAAASGTPGGVLLESVRITSAADVVASQPREYLVGIIVEGGATPGALSVTYDSVNEAQFPAPASGLDPTGAKGMAREVLYALNIPVPGTKAAVAANVGFNGGLAAARFLFSTAPNPKGVPSFVPFRGVWGEAELSSTTSEAVTFDMPGGQDLSPSGFSAMAAIAAGSATGIPSAEVTFPVTPPLTNPWAVPAEFGAGDGRPPKRWPVPAIGPATSYALGFHAVSLGGATDIEVAGVLWL